LICTPIFLPVIKAFGIDPVHFASSWSGTRELAGSWERQWWWAAPSAVNMGQLRGSTAKAAAATGLRQ